MKRTVIFAALAMLVAGCGDEEAGSPEEELRAWVDRGEAAAEAKDRGALLDMISPDYADARGNDRSEIGDILRVYFFRQNSIGLLVDINDIVVSGDTAAMIDLTVGMAGTTTNSALGIRADAYKFEFELEKPEDEWHLIGARWAELGDDLH